MIHVEPPVVASAPFLLDPTAALPNLLVALIAIGVLIVVARVLLNLAWRLVKLATLLVAVLWVLSVVFGVQLLPL